MESLQHIVCHDNCKIAVTCFKEDSESKRNIILTHGTFSNSGICVGMANYLAKKGYTCWVMEWRGHGHSESPKAPTDFEDIALKDVPAIIDYVIRQSPNNEQIVWIGHSGGGLVLPMYLARHPKKQKLFLGIVTIASQASGACNSIVNKVKAYLALGIITLLGYAPGSAVGLGPENESKKMMKQWLAWNIKKSFIGFDKFQYRDSISKIKIPLLSISADKDLFIAPPSGCLEFFEMFGHHDRSHFEIFSECY